MDQKCQQKMLKHAVDICCLIYIYNEVELLVEYAENEGYLFK